ncbi:heme ABC transporter ATP-binding protein [Neiella marina]|uniref:Heme ABC transporter ATP-binding protein n=1 Tax=Neiella holothuriorum TaxID=2870530 RepID=A0ABS7EGW9_9GAMM|nr:heme ABC transporter ATP-binding protein [Neiella holothuriorum]MBW8191592.1 heme ABC transporter ATP-binding protein [Neiella holothuriorum]
MLALRQIEFSVGTKNILDVDAIDLSHSTMGALLGPNGAGKSTLLKAVSGDINANGSILIHGRALSDWPALERAKHVGVLPQQSQLTFPFSAEEVVALGLTPLTLNQAEAKVAIRSVMQETDCERFANRPFPSLSGGERQRVQLARVLLQLSQAQTTPLLLLDEPTSAQDLGQQHQILALARELAHRRGFAVLAVLHDLNQVLQYCDQCFVMSQGKRVASGTPADVLTEQMIEQHWHHRVERLTLNSGQLAVI